MTNAQLKAQIDADIINKTADKSVTRTNVGANIKAVVDYVDQQAPTQLYTTFVAKIFQTGSDTPTMTVLENNTGKAFTITRTGIGTYHIVPNASFSSVLKTTWIFTNIGYGNLVFFNTNLHSNGLGGGDYINVSVEDSTGVNFDMIDYTIVEIKIYP